MPDEDLLLDVPQPEFGAGVVGVCDVCHKRQAVIVLSKERFKLCVMDYLNKGWLRTPEKPAAFTLSFTSTTDYVPTETVPGGIAVVVHLRSTRATKRPLVTVVPDVFGITTATLEAAIRMARAGYDVVMPDVSRTPGIGLIDIGFKRAMHFVFRTVPIRSFHRERLFRVLDVARAEGTKDTLVDPKRQAVIGVGHGGALALAYAAETPGLSAVGVIYPECPSPLGRLRSISAPVFILGGAREHRSGHGFTYIQHVLESAGLQVEVKVIPNGGRDFMNRDSPHYRVRTSEAGWREFVGFMKARLEPPPPPPPKPTPPPATKPAAVPAPPVPPSTPPAASAPAPVPKPAGPAASAPSPAAVA